jgi:A/G-specific adenine glycosylase
MSAFARTIIDWQAQHGRNDLPWQQGRDPYYIWLSEVMLQQTQVVTVIPYYLRFVARFPTLEALAAGGEEEVLRLWSGLGYYSRARNLYRAAQLIASRHGGEFPRGRAEIEALPGIGRSTAAAIAGFAFDARAAILDGNVKRVLARHFAVPGFPGERSVEVKLWELAESLLPQSDISGYSQGLMDLGATLCTVRTPACMRCPLQSSCRAFGEERVVEFPAPRPRRRLQVRQTVMLVLLDCDRVLLVKRPPSGVWGGLWSLPELDPAADVEETARFRFGCTVVDVQHLKAIQHAFTHFTLTIAPRLAKVSEKALRANECGAMWMPLGHALDAALPAPVRRLCQSLAASLTRETALPEVALQDL